jgi:hypothetical protein
MTTALDSTDLSNLRGTGAHVYTGFLAVVPQTSFATARINQASFSRPLMQITVDTTSADWLDVLPGMTVWIGTTAGAHDVGAFRVRLAPGATTLYINEMSTGDFGFIPNTTLTPLGDNQYITVVSDFNKHAVFPKISNGAFLKDGSITYTNQNETGGAVPGVVNIGPHIQSSINPTEITTSWTATTHPFDGTLDDFEWDFADGTPSTASGVGPHSVDFPEGNRWVRGTGTFSGGAVVTAYRHVWAFGATNQPYYLASANSRKTKTGRRMTCRILGTPYNTNPIRQGAMVMYFETTRYNSSATISSAESQFIGWVTSVQLRGEKDGLHEYEVEIVSALELMQQMVMFGQQLVVAANPTHWQEITANLSHIDFVVYYLLHYHTTLPRLFDFERSTLTGYTAPSWKTDRGNVTGEINRVCQRLNMQIQQDSNGTLRLVRDPAMLETSTLRNAMVNRITLTETDVKNIRYNRNLWPAVGMVQANGFNSTTDHTLRVALKSTAPGQVGGTGAGVNTLDNQLVGGGALPAQSDLNNRASNQYTKDNRAIDTYTMDLVRGNYENVIEPSQNILVGISIAQNYSPEGVALSFLAIPTEVSITYNTDGTKNSSLTLEPLYAGYTAPAQTIPVLINEDEDLTDITWPPYDDSGLIDIPYDPFLPIPPITGEIPDPLTDTDQQNTGYLIAWADDGAGVTRTPAAPTFTLLFQPSGEAILSILSDPRSPKLTSNRVNGELRGWALTDAALHYSANMLAGNPTFTSMQDVEHYTLLRAAPVTGAVLGFGQNPSPFDTTYTDNLASGLGAQTFQASAGRPFGHPEASASTPYGDYSASGGRGGGGCFISELDGAVDGFGDARVQLTLIIDLGAEYTVTDVSMWGKVIPDRNTERSILLFDDANALVDTVVNSSGALSSTYTQYSFSGSEAGVRYIVYRHMSAYASGPTAVTTYLDDLSVTYETGDAVVKFYATSTGTAITETAYGTRTSDDTPGDCDDFNLGITMAGGETDLYFSTTYGGSLATMATVDAGTATISTVRIPQRILTGTDLNNSATALHFVVGFDDDDGSGRTLLRGVFNSVANTVSITDITPEFGGNNYHVIGAEALETYAGDSRVMLALVRENGETQIDLAYRDSSGTWTLVQIDVDYSYLRWATSQAAWVAGELGIGFTPDRATTLEDRTGDFATSIADLPLNGAYGRL